MNPEKVRPKNFEPKKILYNENGFSIAYGIWEKKDHVIAMRWNGDSEEDPGYPKVFGNPMWFIIHDDLMTTILKSLLEKNSSKKEEILNLLKTKYTV